MPMKMAKDVVRNYPTPVRELVTWPLLRFGAARTPRSGWSIRSPCGLLYYITILAITIYYILGITIPYGSILDITILDMIFQHPKVEIEPSENDGFHLTNI